MDLVDRISAGVLGTILIGGIFGIYLGLTYSYEVDVMNVDTRNRAIDAIERVSMAYIRCEQ